MKTMLKKAQAKLALAVSMMMAAGAASATATATGSGSAISATGFDSFEATMLSWVQGPLGVGLAVTSLLVGGGIGILRATPLPAVAGLALAAFFAWGPAVIVSLVSGGAVVG